MSQTFKTSRLPARRGSVMIYSIVAILTLMSMAMLVIDWGRIQSAKSELQSTTDGAARYAAAGLRSTMQNTSGAVANASAVFADNRVDNFAASGNVTPTVELGIWTAASKTFTVTTDTTVANAVRVRSALILGNAAHPLTFVTLLGKTMTINAQSIAMINGQDSTTYVSAKGNPWLAGMPAGTLCTDFRTDPSEQDYAGSGPNIGCSPGMVSLPSLGVSGGAVITFDGVTGGADFTGTAVNNDADGSAALLVNLGSPTFGSTDYFTSPINGMSNCHAPINSMMAVFLDDNVPTSTSAPLPLDFSTPESRDYTSLSPQLKQVFFVGDGRRSNGEIQQIVVPPGAKRLFIANMDGWQYNNNIGGYNLTIHAVHTISTVQMR